jgi:hypothetical protein
MRSTHNLTKFAVILLAGTALASFSVTRASADADAGKEVGTAAQHAGLAAKATEMKMVQMHLHHVVNCLVGPSGQGFDISFGNPCKDQGNGAIPDTAEAAKKTMLNQALAKANAGLKLTDMAGAQKDAGDVQAMLSPKM